MKAMTKTIVAVKSVRITALQKAGYLATSFKNQLERKWMKDAKIAPRLRML